MQQVWKGNFLVCALDLSLATGTIMVRFDNSHSMLRSKTVQYSVRVDEAVAVNAGAAEVEAPMAKLALD